MDIQKYITNNKLNIKVIANSSKNKLIEENKQLKLYLKAIPDKNKANLELIKYFDKQFNLKVEIKSGRKSKNKLLMII